MGFKKKKLWHIWSFKEIFYWIKNTLASFAFFVKLVFVLVFISAMLYLSVFAIDFGRSLVQTVSSMAFDVITTHVGEEFEKDEFWQINVLILWYDDGYLADAIMLASYDPQIWSVSFLSIPRDLYVQNTDIWYNGRINWILPTVYYNNWNISEGIFALQNTVSDITWIDVDYYSLIDFDWFVDIVDYLGGVQIDVPETIIDHKYPTPDGGYQTFEVQEWLQNFDWAKALKYARSRQTTSDFSRSYRQQLIIEWIIDEVISVKNLANPSVVQELYWKINNMLETNISFRQMLSATRYANDLKHFNNFVLTADCDRSHFSTTDAWCFLYYPQRDLFGWHSVLLQEWATPSNVSNYTNIHNFAFFVLHNQDFLIEGPKISLYNGIDRQNLINTYWRSKPVANNLAVELAKYGFDISDVKNSSDIYEKNIIYVDDLSSYETTIQLLKIFIDIDEVIQSNELEYNMRIVLWDKKIE